MKAIIKHKSEIINIDTDLNITRDQLIQYCINKIKTYYENHKNQIIIDSETIDLDIRLFIKPKTQRVETKIIHHLK